MLWAATEARSPRTLNQKILRIMRNCWVNKSGPRCKRLNLWLDQQKLVLWEESDGLHGNRTSTSQAKNTVDIACRSEKHPLEGHIFTKSSHYCSRLLVFPHHLLACSSKPQALVKIQNLLFGFSATFPTKRPRGHVRSTSYSRTTQDLSYPVTTSSIINLSWWTKVQSVVSCPHLQLSTSETL